MSSVSEQIKKARSLGLQHLDEVCLGTEEETKFSYMSMRHHVGGKVNKWVDNYLVKIDDRHDYLRNLGFDVMSLSTLTNKQQKVMRMNWDDWKSLKPSKRKNLSKLVRDVDKEMEEYFNQVSTLSDEVTSEILHRDPVKGCGTIQLLVTLEDVEQHQVCSAFQMLVMCYRAFYELWKSQ